MKSTTKRRIQDLLGHPCRRLECQGSYQLCDHKAEEVDESFQPTGNWVDLVKCDMCQHESTREILVITETIAFECTPQSMYMAELA